MARILSVIVFGAIALAACSHNSRTSTGKCSACPPEKACASAEEVEELGMMKQRTSSEFDALDEKCRKATAWQARWNETFLDLEGALVDALSPEEEEDDEVDGNMEKVVRYAIDVYNGDMHVTFKNAQLFKKGKAELSVMGLDIIDKLTAVIESIPERKITIGSRTTVRNENLGHTQWLQVRELSARRALSVMSQFEENGLDPSYLIAASLSNRLEEDPLESGTTVLIFHPIAGEIPRFPEWHK